MLLDSRTKTVIGDDSAVVLDDWHPRVVDDVQRSLIVSKALPQIDAYLSPAKGDALAGRITVLLAHYFVAPMPGVAWAAVIEDWRKALCSFPMWAVEAGCNRWIAEQPRKPTPAGVRKMVEEAVFEAEEERKKLRAIIALPPPSNELVKALDGIIPHTAIKTWVTPLTLTVINDMAVVRCPSRFHRDWVRTHYGDAIFKVQKGRLVHILASDEPDPKPMTDADRENMKARIARMRPGRVIIPLYPEERMSAETKDRIRTHQSHGAEAAE